MKKYNRKDNCSYTLGISITLELLENRPESAERIYFHSKLQANSAFTKINKLCQTYKIEIIPSDKAFNVVSDKENCWVIGVFRKYETHLADDNHLVLVNPANNGNLGTIMRTCVGFGLHNIAIIKPAVDAFDPQVIRASMGAFFHLNFQYFDDFTQYQELYPANYIYPFMLQATQFLPNLKIKSPYSLVFGNEATGLNPQFLNIGTPVRIAHTANIDSLNLDNAVSIALYECTKKDFL